MKTELTTQGIITIPVEAEITFADCKAYSRKIAEFINKQVASKMIECGISSNCVFADIWAQPFLIDDPNPHKNLMNVLKQFANIAAGGYDATIRLEAARKEIDRLNHLLDQLTPEL